VVFVLSPTSARLRNMRLGGGGGHPTRQAHPPG
jgi:hypothetical protein